MSTPGSRTGIPATDLAAPAALSRQLRPIGAALLALLAFVTLSSTVMDAKTPRSDRGTDAPIRFAVARKAVPRYDILQVDITIPQPPAGNPFRDRHVFGEFTHVDSGETMLVDGYCDSQDGSKFGLRFCPRHEGEYTYDVTYVDDTQTAHHLGRFDCVPSTIPGFLRVSETHDRHFQFEGNGEFFYHQGYNIFQLLQQIVGDANWKAALDYLDNLGFNKVRFLLLGGRSCDLYHYLLFPFVGTDPYTDAQYDRYNVETWAHYDKVIRYMADREMIASCIFEIGKERIPRIFGGWDSPTEDEYAYYRYAMARLGAYWNVTWDLGNEHIEFHTRNWSAEMGAFVKEHDPYQHLLSAHAYRFYPYPEAPWSDYAILQAYAGGGSIDPPETLDWEHFWYVVYTSHYERYPTPVINDEYGFVGAWPADYVRKSHWATTMCGSYASSGSFESLSVRRCRDCECGRCEPPHCNPDHVFYDDHETVPPQLAHHKALFESLEFWQLEPTAYVIEEAEHYAFCRSKFPGEYLLYLPDGGSVTVDLSRAEGLDLPVEWMNPITGEWRDATPATTGGAASFTGTAPFEDDAVLYIGRMRSNEPYSDDFDSASGDWKQVSGDWTLVDGAYVLLEEPADSTAMTVLPSHRYDDFTLSFDLRHHGDQDWAGVHFRKDQPLDDIAGSGYLLTIYRSGWINLLEARDGGVELLRGGFQPAFDRRRANRFEIRAFGDFIDVSLNGQEIYRVKARTSHPRGYVALASSSPTVAFDNLEIEPLQFENFDDLDTGFIIPRLGDWKIDRDRALRQRDKGGRPRAGIGDVPLADVEIGYRVQIAGGSAAAAAGLYLGSPHVPEYLGPLTGYLFLYAPIQGTVEIRKLDDGVLIDAARVAIDQPGGINGAGLVPVEMNTFEVEVVGNTIRASNRGRLLVTYTDATVQQIEGNAALITTRAQARFDEVLVHRKD